jgi:hypothetical protein
LWKTAIEYVHERTAHQGAAATAEKLSNAFFFPFMKKEVAEMVEACEGCQMKMRRGANDQRHTYATTSRELPLPTNEYRPGWAIPNDTRRLHTLVDCKMHLF